MTTVGYGDIHPESSEEKLYTICMMVVSCGVFAWIMGSLASFVRRSDAALSELQDEIYAINQYMLHNKLPKKFRHKVKRYLAYVVNYKRQYKIEEEEVIAMLPENLQIELVAHLNGGLLHDTRTFKGFDIMFLSQVTYALEKETFTNYEYIL